MAVYKDTVTVETKGGKVTYCDITQGVADAVAKSGIKEGVVTVISCHTTCAVFSQEYDHDHTPDGDTFMQADLTDGLAKIFPDENDWGTYRYPGLQHFEAVESWPNAEAYLPGGDRRALWNGDAHLRSVLVGGSQAFEVADGKLEMNGLASIYFVDFDRARERTRRARIIVVGE